MSPATATTAGCQLGSPSDAKRPTFLGSAHLVALNTNIRSLTLFTHGNAKFGDTPGRARSKSPTSTTTEASTPNPKGGTAIMSQNKESARADGRVVLAFPPDDVPEPWLFKGELAAYLGYTPRWVERRVREGMPHTRTGKRNRFRVSDVEAWLNARRSA